MTRAWIILLFVVINTTLVELVAEASMGSKNTAIMIKVQ
jgi:hypothetical protein